MNLLMLTMLGLWPRGDTYTILYTVYSTITLATFQISHILVQAIYIYFIYDDLIAVTGIIYMLLSEVLEVFKEYYLITNMKTLKQLLRFLDTDMFQPKNSQQIEAIEENIKGWKTNYKAFLYLCYVCLIINSFLAKSNTGERRLPFIAWYPYNELVSPLYEITYTYQILCIVFITTVHVNIDAFVAALNVFNASQFDILCDNLRNLHQLNNNSKNVGHNLIYCVKHHLKILSFAEKSNTFLNWILLGQFAVSCITIAFSMFQLTMVTLGSREFYALVTYLSAMTAQIFMYCSFGNEVDSKSRNVLDAAFQSDWRNFPLDVKKDLIFFMLRAQKPVILSALNLFNLSLDTFMKILKTSWSYFALLQNVSS